MSTTSSPFAAALLVPLLLGAPAAAESGPVRLLRHLSVEDGLSHDIVYAGLQDRRGFVWLATEDGLDRYDGHRFESFHSGDGGLSSGDVSWIAEDRRGDLWIATWGGGLDRYEAAADRFGYFRHAGDDPASLADDRIQTIHEDTGGRLWIGTYRGLERLDRGSGVFVHHLPGERIWSISEAPDGLLWIATDHGVARFDVVAGTSVPFRHDPDDPHTLSSDATRVAYHDARGVLWVGSERGLDRFDLLAGRFERVAAVRASVNTVHEDRRGTLWIGTNGAGLLRFDRDSGRAEAVARAPGDDVRAIWEDDSGLLWVATRGAGVAVLDLEPPAFASRDGLSHPVVLSVLETRDGTLWVGTERGLDRFSSDGTHRGLREDPTLALVESREGEVLIGSFTGLDAVDPATGRRRALALPDAPEAFRLRQVQDLVEADGGRWWVATRGGLLDLDPATGDTVVHLAGELVWTLHRDGNGILWLGTDTHGLVRFEPETGLSRAFVHDPAKPRSLSNDRVTSIGETDDGALWIATARGLDRFDRASATFERFFETEGLPSSTVQCLLVEPASGPGGGERLWLSTNRGLSRFDPASRRFRHFDTSDGLNGLLFTRDACHRGPSGRMYFGGLKGLNEVDPACLREPPRGAPVVLTSFRVFQQPVRLAETGDAVPRAELSYQESFFSFEFTALDYRSSEHTRFTYRLDGFDDDWIDAGSRRYAGYTNVPPGHYLFQVRASHGDGVWDDAHAASVRIVITPPFWQTGWFRAAAALTGILAILAVHRLRTRAIRVQNRRLEQQVRERTVELRKLNQKKNEFLGIAAHDLRSPLGGVISYVDLLLRLLDEDRVDKTLWRRFLGNVRSTAHGMRELISQLLDVTAIESGKLSLSLARERLADLLEERSELHVRAARDKRITLEWDASEAGVEVVIDRIRIAEVIDNLVTNAIKYTEPGGQVRVHCEVARGEIVTHVEDTGQGLEHHELELVFGGRKGSARPTAGESSTGLGLVIVKKIVEMHGGRAWATSVKGEGSTFSFSIPAGGGG